MIHNDARDLKLNIDKAALKSLYQIHPLRHATQLVLNWLLILAAIYLSEVFFHPLAYGLAVLLIGNRMYALTILMHDAAHYRFLHHKKWNDLITNLTTMYWMFSNLDQYRANHYQHHQHLNTEQDPDWFAKLGKQKYTFPKSKTEFVLTSLSYLFLVHGLLDAIWFFRRFEKFAHKVPTQAPQKWQKLLFYGLLVLLLTVLGGWKLFLLYWIVPYFSTFFMFQYIRSVAEHFGGTGI